MYECKGSYIEPMNKWLAIKHLQILILSCIPIIVWGKKFINKYVHAKPSKVFVVFGQKESFFISFSGLFRNIFFKMMSNKLGCTSTCIKCFKCRYCNFVCITFWIFLLNLRKELILKNWSNIRVLRYSLIIHFKNECLTIKYTRS